MLTLGLDIGGSSAKAAVINAGAIRWEATSPRYARPSRAELMGALRELLRDAPLGAARVGLCVPGLLNADRTAIEKSVNLPGLVGVRLDELVAGALPGAGAVPQLSLTSDAHAAAFDVWSTEQPAGRLLCLSLGTGVGGCVLDDGVPLHVSGSSPGHFGQLDVSVGHQPPSGLADSATSPAGGGGGAKAPQGGVPLGPDGGRGSLEAYIGLPALLRTYGSDPERTLAVLTADSPPLLALGRALRICHAIYRPQHIRLLGGVGIRLSHLVGPLRERVAHELTSVAREGWTLAAGTTDFHAARGAARLAALPL